VASQDAVTQGVLELQSSALVLAEVELLEHLLVASHLLGQVDLGRRVRRPKAGGEYIYIQVDLVAKLLCEFGLLLIGQ